MLALSTEATNVRMAGLRPVVGAVKTEVDAIFATASGVGRAASVVMDGPTLVWAWAFS